MNDLTDTQINRTFSEQWAWIPGFVKRKFTPTSVVSILIAAFSCGGVAASYRAKFHEAEKSRASDHRLLVKQVDVSSKQADAINSIAVQLAHLDGTLQGLDRRLSLQEQWQQKVTGTAETISVPRVGRHGKHTP